MYIGLDKILGHKIFKETKVIAGKNGLTNPVERISVFDCPYDERVIEDGIIKPGDLFITCLEQFRYEAENIYIYISTLIESKSAGLLIAKRDYPNELSDEIIEICNQNSFPIVWIKEDIPYAVIIDTVNKYISMEVINAINALKLDKVRYGMMPVTEKMNIIYSINPDIKKFMRVLEVKGDYTSEITKMEWHIFYMNQSNDIYVRNKNHLLFILSADTEKELKQHSNVTIAKFNGILDDPKIGCSRIHDRREIPLALEEATKALATAISMDIRTMEYDPMSSLQLLLTLKDSIEAYDFYNTYVKKIGSNISVESVEETLLTIETYVSNQGNFSKTAQALNQHENTIRYRISKAKIALGMENDNIKFHETIAIAAKLRTLINTEQ